MPADPGNKTDETDLYAQHRAAVAGFGLCELELQSPYREVQLRARHRRNLVEKGAAIACQIREHLHLAMPGYANLFDRLFECPPALAIARHCGAPAKVLELGKSGLSQALRESNVAHRSPTLDKVLAWASQATNERIPDGPMHHAIWTDLHDKIAKRFTRLALACVAGDEPMRHPSFQKPDSILEKLRRFHHEHGTPMDRLLADLETTVEQLPYNTRNHEADVVADVLQRQTSRRRGAVALGELLPAVLARLRIRSTNTNDSGDRP